MVRWLSHLWNESNQSIGNAFNYRLEGSGAEFGPTWEKPSDVAGLFWDCETGSVAFTRNGATVGLAFRNVFGSFFPAVGLNSPSAVVAVNFGQRPFAFGKIDQMGIFRSVANQVLQT